MLPDHPHHAARILNLLLATILLFSAAPAGALAQGTLEQPSRSSAEAQNGGYPFGTMPETPGGNVLYDQTDNQGENAISSQEFEPANSTFDNQAADDFVVTDGEGWTIEALFIPGVYFNGVGPMPAVNVYFYADNGGLPGTPVRAYEGHTSFTDAGGTLTIDLSASPTPLAAGTYWVSIQADMDFAVGGQWGWTERTVQSLSASAWRNPLDGYGSGCVNWSPRVGCNVGTQPDLLFQIIGTVGGTPPHKLALPLMMRGVCFPFPGPGEAEPNDTSGQANGPLCFGRPYTGSPNNDLPYEERDWFYVNWDGDGSLKIDVVNFLTDAQVLLFYQAEANGYILREFSQPDGHYELLCGPACSLGRSGKYLIHIFAPANHPSLPNQYTIEATLLP